MSERLMPGTAELPDGERVPEIDPAGIVTRGLAAALDVLVVFSMCALFYLGVALTRVLFSPRNFTWPAYGFFFSTFQFVVISIVYLAFWWSTSGRTVGGALFGARVVTRRGRRVNWSVALLRAVFCTFFPIGLAWVALNRHRHSVQDIALRTVVVYDSPKTRVASAAP